jgi:hypothetical protein
MVEASVTPADILAFWRDAGPDRWYTPDDSFDAEVRQRFLDLWRQAAAGEFFLCRHLLAAGAFECDRHGHSPTTRSACPHTVPAGHRAQGPPMPATLVSVSSIIVDNFARG